MKLSLSRFIQRTSAAIGAELTEASANADPVARPVAAGPATLTPAGREPSGTPAAAASAGAGAHRPAVERPVDRQRGERRRLVAVEAGLPRRADAAAVEERLVAEHAAGHAAHAAVTELRRERAGGRRRERGVAVALQDEVAVPDAVDQLALAEHGRLDAERRPEHDERRVGHGQLLVRGRHERQPLAAAEERLAGRQVDGERGGEPGVRDGERLERPRAEIARPGRRRGRDDGQACSGNGQAGEAAHRRILRIAPVGVNRDWAASRAGWAVRPMEPAGSVAHNRPVPGRYGDAHRPASRAVRGGRAAQRSRRSAS